MKPIHKFNNGNLATICNQCSVIITTNLTNDLYCKECNKYRKELLQEIMKEDEDLGLYIEQMEKEEPKQRLEEVAEKRFPSKMEMYEVFIEDAKWQQEQDKNKYIALETAISLLKQTTEYEVLDSWKQKVKELEQFKKK
jgi:hypothetical protein